MHSEKNLTNLSQMPVIDSLDDNFQLVTDCYCKQMHNLFPTVDNSDDQEFVRFQSMARSSSPCSNAGLKCDQEEKQNGAQAQVRFGTFRRQHVTLNRRAVCKATQVISYILNRLYSQQIIFSTGGLIIFFWYYWIQGCKITLLDLIFSLCVCYMMLYICC